VDQDIQLLQLLQNYSKLPTMRGLTFINYYRQLKHCTWSCNRPVIF